MSEHKPLPPLAPWPIRAWWAMRSVITWPATVRQLKAVGAVRLGFMEWEIPPATVMVSLTDLRTVTLASEGEMATEDYRQAFLRLRAAAEVEE